MLRTAPAATFVVAIGFGLTNYALTMLSLSIRGSVASVVIGVLVIALQILVLTQILVWSVPEGGRMPKEVNSLAMVTAGWACWWWEQSSTGWLEEDGHNWNSPHWLASRG